MSDVLPVDEDGNLIVRIGHSPDPDDAFMFYAMTTNAFPTPGYNFVHELQDIETLNHQSHEQGIGSFSSKHPRLSRHS